MNFPAHHDREARILALWERAVGLGRWQRDDALLESIGTPPRSLGARNAALLAVRNHHCNRTWPLRSQCPSCGDECEFTADSVALAEELEGLGAAEAVTLDWAGRSVKVRAPTAQDLQEIAHDADVRGAVRALLARCLSGELDLAQLDDGDIDELGRQIEALDPGAVFGFDLACPACGHAWLAAVDIAEALWSELRVAAERSLIEVDTLARAYGWTEAEVMRLSPVRRAAYLQLVESSS